MTRLAKIIPAVYSPNFFLKTIISFLLCTPFAMQAANSATTQTDTENIISPQSQFVNDPVFTGKIYLEQWGDNSKPSIILIHGLGDNGAKDWRYLAPVLARSFHVITFDLPGFGRSDKNNELYSPDNYARLVDWLATRYARKPFILIGHSMGGVVALTYATNHPDNLKQLILIDTTGILFSASFSKSLMKNYKPHWWMHLIPDASELNKQLGFGIEDIYGVPQAIDLALSTPLTRKMFLGANPARIAGLAMVQKNFSGFLEKVTMPTLIIWGDKDNIAPLRTGKMLDFLLSNSRLIVIPESKHVPMIDDTARLNKIILDAVTNPQPHDTATSTTDTSHRIEDGQCDKQDETHYSGLYDHLVINECTDVTIDNAQINQLVITRSNVTITNSRIGGNEKALTVSDSTVFATATKINGDIPIHVDDSRLDFAGVLITAGKQVFLSTSSFQVTYSLCRLTSPEFTGYRHGIYEFSEGHFKNQQ